MKIEVKKGQERLIDLAPSMADVARKWGFRFLLKHGGFENLCVFQTEAWAIDPKITITADIRENEQTLVVSSGTQSIGLHSFGNPGGQEEILILLPKQVVETKSPLGLSIVTTLKEGVLVIDKKISPFALPEILQKIDEEAERRGLLEKPNGKLVRKPLPEITYIQPQKLKVGEVFAERGSLFPVSPGEDISELKEMFDRPEDLIEIRDPYSGDIIGLGHARDGEYFNQRAKVLNEVLLKYNLTPQDLLTYEKKLPELHRLIVDEIRRRFERLSG